MRVVGLSEYPHEDFFYIHKKALLLWSRAFSFTLKYRISENRIQKSEVRKQITDDRNWNSEVGWRNAE
jgi:hypothetical protein